MPGFASQAVLPQSRTLLLAVLALVTTTAWVALWHWGATPTGFSHQHHAVGGESAGMPALVFIGGWTLMSIAMMLPTSVPVVMIFERLAGGRPDHPLLVGLVVAGYLLAWALFGMAVYAAVVLVQTPLASSEWLESNSWVVAASILLLAGAYQFTPLKYRCLDKCRSPFSFVVEHWQGRRERWQAFRLGIRHGVFCVGCCWALMLLMFAVSAGSLAWMLCLTVVMAVEKNLPWGRRLSAPLGVALLAWGTFLIVRA